MTQSNENTPQPSSTLHSEPLLYGIEDRPKKLWESLFYGYQHTLVDISPFIVPLAVASAIGMSAGDQSQFINLCLFSMGLATLIQTTIGNRLPIIQGPSTILIGVITSIGAQMGAAVMWGAIFVGGILEAIIGISGSLKYIRKLFPPAVSGVVVIGIGLSLGQVAVMLAVGDGSARNFSYAGFVMLLIFVLQIRFSRMAGGLISRGAVLFSMFFVGLFVASLFGHVDWALVKEKEWFALPRLFPYGGPGFGWEFAIAAILTCLAGYLGSMVESLGDYAATCAVCQEKYEAKHINRGIFAEGVGCVVASIFGGLPCTSFTQNIGIIASTKVASRFVVQVSAVIFLIYGICPKFGGLLVAMPRAVLGGVFVVICAMITMAGMRLAMEAKNTLSNQLLVGITLIVSIGLPIYIKTRLSSEWLEAMPTAVQLVLTNTVVLVVLLSLSLNVLLNLILKGEES